jgi:hypothetical protein
MMIPLKTAKNAKFPSHSNEVANGPTFALIAPAVVASVITVPVTAEPCCHMAPSKPRTEERKKARLLSDKVVELGKGFTSISEPVISSFSLCHPGNVATTMKPRSAAPMLPSLSSVQFPGASRYYMDTHRSPGYITSFRYLSAMLRIDKGSSRSSCTSCRVEMLELQKNFPVDWAQIPK